jgi:hypothetical protein
VQLRLLGGGYGVDVCLAQTGLAHHALIEHPDAGGDRAQRELGLIGNAELADQEHVQGGVQLARHLEGNGDPTPGQSHD